MRRRVVITGMGAISPLGDSVNDLYENQLRGKSGVGPTGFIRGGLVRFHPGAEYEQEMHTTPGHLAEYFDLEGPNYNCLTACAASSQALGEAAELIRAGDADLMLSGGSHSMIHPF